MEKKRILIAEDDQDILNVMIIMLKSAGYEVEGLTRGKEVIELPHSRPDLVILDKRMPDMDGTDVCRELRSRPDTKDVPVFLISAGADLRREAAEAGINEVLKKPFAMHTLLNLVSKYIKNPAFSQESLHKKKIYMVEDNRDIVIALESILSTAGYNVQTFSHGKKMLDQNNEPPDLYILDKKLPDIDGLDICRILRKNKATAKTPIIVVTTSLSDKNKAKEAGATAFIQKPFTVNNLLKQIDLFIENP